MIHAVAAIVECQARLLICQRRRADLFALQWEFPGGKVFAQETPEQALARELREELAVEARIGRELYRVRHKYEELAEEVEVVFFTASITGTPSPQGETRAARPAADGAVCALPRVKNLAFERISWARRSDLTRYRFLSADRELVERLARGELRG